MASWDFWIVFLGQGREGFLFGNESELNIW